MGTFDGKVAIVTGAGRGIGRGEAMLLAAEGASVVVNDLGVAREGDGGSATPAQEVVNEITAAGGTAITSGHDVSSWTGAQELIATAVDQFGGLDVLVNNAGASFDGFDASVARRTLDVNFTGMMQLTDRLLPLLRANARVVMVSSGMGDVSSLGAALRKEILSPSLDRAALVAFVDRFVADVAAGTHVKGGWPSNAYRVSKIAMNAYVRILARDLAGDPRKILVNAACPGWVRTAMGGAGAPRSPEEGAKTPSWLALLPVGDSRSGGLYRDEKPVDW
jgi:carbonyl reductase 1